MQISRTVLEGREEGWECIPQGGIEPGPGSSRCVLSAVVKPLEESGLEVAKPGVIQLLEEADALCCFFPSEKI